jgi:hypothetical protein
MEEGDGVEEQKKRAIRANMAQGRIERASSYMDLS